MFVTEEMRQAYLKQMSEAALHERLSTVAIKRQIVHNSSELANVQCFFGILPSMEAEIDCKLQSNSR